MRPCWSKETNCASRNTVSEQIGRSVHCLELIQVPPVAVGGRGCDRAFRAAASRARPEVPKQKRSATLSAH